MDNRKNNGAKKGEYRGQGRKPKAEELELIAKLSPLDDIAFRELKSGVESGNFAYVKMFFEYRFGKPKEKVEHSGDMGVIWQEVKTYAK